MRGRFLCERLTKDISGFISISFKKSEIPMVFSNVSLSIIPLIIGYWLNSFLAISINSWIRYCAIIRCPSVHDMMDQSFRDTKAIKELLLDKNRSIQDIAFQVGFNSSINFTRAFKKYEGITPSKYREVHT